MIKVNGNFEQAAAAPTGYLNFESTHPGTRKRNSN